MIKGIHLVHLQDFTTEAKKSDLRQKRNDYRVPERIN